ncbi:MAG TPA: site-specific integrase, partial [Geomobilimonas sp.]|nr:site-specific integrase [Geomobilimonas sp.]
MNDHIAQFIRYLGTERNVSPHTLEAYRRDIEQFHAFVREERGDGATVAAIDHIMIRRYLALLHKECRKSSIGRKLAALRAFFTYLVREGVVARNPAELVATPKREKKVPFHLSIDEVTALVEAPREGELLS